MQTPLSPLAGCGPVGEGTSGKVLNWTVRSLNHAYTTTFQLQLCHSSRASADRRSVMMIYTEQPRRLGPLVSYYLLGGCLLNGSLEVWYAETQVYGVQPKWKYTLLYYRKLYFTTDNFTTENFTLLQKTLLYYRKLNCMKSIFSTKLEPIKIPIYLSLGDYGVTPAVG